MDLDRIREAERINGLVAELYRRRDTLLAMDTPDFGDLLAAYRQWSDEPGRPSSTKVFIFLALYYYDPLALTGARMQKHLRSKIAAALGVKTPTVVSKRARNLLFTYDTYRRFREAVQELNKKIEKDYLSTN